jgi:hypothetical protein
VREKIKDHYRIKTSTTSMNFDPATNPLMIVPIGQDRNRNRIWSFDGKRVWSGIADKQTLLAYTAPVIPLSAHVHWSHTLRPRPSFCPSWSNSMPSVKLPRRLQLPPRFMASAPNKIARNISRPRNLLLPSRRRASLQMQCRTCFQRLRSTNR